MPARNFDRTHGRVLDIVEKQWLDMADRPMQGPLEADQIEALAAKDREVFGTGASPYRSPPNPESP